MLENTLDPAAATRQLAHLIPVSQHCRVGEQSRKRRAGRHFELKGLDHRSEVCNAMFADSNDQLVR